MSLYEEDSGRECLPRFILSYKPQGKEKYATLLSEHLDMIL